MESEVLGALSLSLGLGLLIGLQRERAGSTFGGIRTFPLLALLVIEGTIRDLDPEVDFQETAKPVIVKGLYGQHG